MISLCSKYEINTSTGELARLVLILPCLLLQGGENMSKGVYYDFINIYDSTDALTTRINPKPIGSQIWFASVRAQCHCFPTAWKRKSIRMVVGSRPEVTEGNFLYFSVFRSSGKDKNFKPQTQATFYLKFISLQYIKRWGS